MKAFAAASALVGSCLLWRRPSLQPWSSRLIASARSEPTIEKYDFAVIGGGIVGVATACELASRKKDRTFVLLEKESKLAVHQSGRNSGVIHSGIYYKPGSLKAKLCVEGLKRTYQYCDEKKIPYKKCGKLIVAVTPEEVPRLEELFRRGLENGVKDLRLIGPEEFQKIEPNCRGLKAIHSPHTGIVDFGDVTRSLGDDFTTGGGQIRFQYHVNRFKPGDTEHPVVIASSDGREVHCKAAVVCAGLHADRLAQLSGGDPNPRIVPFRGEYLRVRPEAAGIVNGNIYPVPDPRFPFLGVHFTPRMDGSLWLGPNAVLAYKREGYSYTDISLRDLTDAISHSGLRKLAVKYFGFGLKEIYRGINTRAQVAQLQRFVPSLQFADVDHGPSGVRAQALDADGNLVDDFVFEVAAGQLGSRVLHVRNAPSPAATSSMAIARLVADRAEQEFKAV